MTTVFVRITSEEERQLLYNSIKDVCYNGVSLVPLNETVLNCKWSRVRYSKFDTEPLSYLGSWDASGAIAGYVNYSVPDFLKLINKQLEEIPL